MTGPLDSWDQTWIRCMNVALLPGLSHILHLFFSWKTFHYRLDKELLSLRNLTNNLLRCCLVSNEYTYLEEPNCIAILETIVSSLILSLWKLQYFKVRKHFLSVLYKIIKCSALGKERDGKLMSMKFGNYERTCMFLYDIHTLNHTNILFGTSVDSCLLFSATTGTCMPFNM